MGPKFAREPRKYLSKNKSVKLFKEKRKKRDEYANQRQQLLSQYEKIDVSNIESFDQLPLTNQTRRGLKKCNYHTLTEIQRQAIGLALQSHDILGAAKTGSGKTLAFVVPVLERLFCEGWCKTDGLGALIITPTRELAMQIFQVFQNVGTFHDFTIGLVIGGKDLRDERKILHLYNIVICTPGRLLMHLDQNAFFQTSNLQMLVLDEADRILDEGFQNDVNAILEHLGDIKRQTLLFSATQTKSVKDLARLSLKNPMYVSVHEHAKHATPETLEQSFLVCELPRKLDFLWSFIKSHKKQKILIFMASCKQVKYTFDAFCRMKPGVSLTALYGGLHQLRRMERYQDFCNKNHVVMFATDIAARGLDFPNVNWVVQLDCPEDVNTYIHRAGRTARYQKGGESLLVLLPSEKESMIKQLKDRKIPINEIKVHPRKLMSIQRKMEAQCARDVELKESARRISSPYFGQHGLRQTLWSFPIVAQAFVAYYKNIFLMKDKTVFDILQLNVPEVRVSFAKSLGLAFDPRTRFIEKRLKTQVISKIKDEADIDSGHDDDEKFQQKLKINSDDDSSDDDDFLVPKAKETVQSLLQDEASSDEEKLQSNLSSKVHKPLTKAAMAKKFLKKKIKPNMKILFNEDGEAVEDVPKKIRGEISSELLKEMAEEGYSLEKARLILDKEDEIDKAVYRTKIQKKHRDQRMKLKEQRRRDNPDSTSAQLGDDKTEDGDGESSGSDIDPNNMSDSEDDLKNDDEQPSSEFSEEDDNDISEDEDQNHLKRKRSPGENLIKPSKKTKLRHGDDDNDNLYPGTLEDEENLALHFLTNS